MIQYDTPPPPPPPLPSEDYVSDRMARGHFRPEDIGMPEGIFGMGRQELQTWLPSNVLMGSVLRQLGPQAQEQMRYQKIDRPAGMMQDGNGDMASGVYRDGSIGVTRLVADPRFAGTPYDERTVGRHEVLHALSLENPQWRDDIDQGAPNLVRALAQSGWNYPPELLSDPYHLWTRVAEQVLTHPDWETPPPIRSYFGSLLPR